MSWHDATAVKDEEEIVWLEDPATLPYVREDFIEKSTRRRPIAYSYGENKAGKVGEPGQARTVGYAVLRPDARGTSPGMFRRRVFWLKEYDRVNIPFLPEQEDNRDCYQVTAPTEAVDPLTVVPGKLGELTERAWGRPLRKG